MVISLLNQSSAEVPATICQELAQIHFFPEDPQCTDWDSLCTAIRERMSDEETPVHRLLLLLDEADAFTKSADSNPVSYTHLHEFREWYRPVADHGCNYGFYHRKMDACCAAVNEASEQLKGQYRERLMELRNTLPVSVLENQENNILDVISDLIEERVYSVADDYMRMAAEGQTTPPVSYMLSGSCLLYTSRCV